MTDTAKPQPAATALPSRPAGELPGPPPPPGSWATRADLLRDRRKAVAALHQADLSLRTMLVTGLLVVAATCALATTGSAFMPVDDDEHRSTQVATNISVGVIGAVVGAFLTWKAWRRTMRAREVGLCRQGWEDLADDPAARALPRGDLPAELREPFDARNDPDAHDFVGTELVKRYVSPWENRLLARAAITGLAFVPGIAGLLAPTVSSDPVAAGMCLGGAVLVAACAVQFTKSTQRGYRATQRWKKGRDEHQQWNAQRPHGPAT